jgi:hypothetical protein
VTTLWCVDGDASSLGVSLLADAARTRRIGVCVPDVLGFDFGTRAAPGDILVRTGVSPASVLVEQHLWSPGVRTTYCDPDDLHIVVDQPGALLAKHGISVPRQVVCLNSERSLLRAHVEHLGGFPVVVKVGGFEGGLGVMLAESPASLASIVDHLLASGRPVTLQEFIGDADHWRVVLVRGTVVATYPNPTPTDDFRSKPSTSPADYTIGAPPTTTSIATAAAAILRAGLAGVDVLVRGDERWVLEVNTPCFFAQAQVSGGVDVAGAILDVLRTA